MENKTLIDKIMDTLLSIVILIFVFTIQIGYKFAISALIVGALCFIASMPYNWASVWLLVLVWTIINLILDYEEEHKYDSVL